MARFTITPWRTNTDLLAVRSQLYQLDPTLPDSRQHAVHRVMAWKLRGNLPHAIESTALLIDAILHHSIPGTSVFSIRAVYSAAFTRFVTGFCDIGRNKERSLEPSSMLDIAKQIGMPVHFVALRHEATHEELPNVGRIVRASGEALKWLWNVYWSRLEEPEVELTLSAEMLQLRAEAKQILREFRTQRLEILRSKKRKDQDGAAVKAVEACGELVQRSKEKMKTFVEALMEEKFLIPSKRIFGSSLQGAFLLWDEFLQNIILEQVGFVQALVECVLSAIRSKEATKADEDAEKEALSLWVLHILTDDDWTKKITDPERYVLLKEVMQWCCMYPSYWAQFIGRELLKVENDEFDETWREILEASQLRQNSADIDVANGILQSSNLEVAEGILLEHLEQYKSDAEGPEELQSWTRGPIPRNTPIGVVAR